MEQSSSGAARAATAAEAVADRLRSRIFDGALPPGNQLYEEHLAVDLGASRNTLREAFRILSHERLVRHERHRGVFVRTPTAADARDLWRAREVLECGALLAAAASAASPLEVPGHGAQDLTELTAAAAEAAEGDDWRTVGTVNAQVHLAICALAGSERLQQEARRLLTEVRLVFVAVADPRSMHEPWLAANAELAVLVGAGEYVAAERALRDYLRRSGEAVVGRLAR